jgi:hypothetical protein
MTQHANPITGLPYSSPRDLPPLRGDIEIQEKDGSLIVTVDGYYTGMIPSDQLCVETIDMLVDLLQKKILSGLHHSIINAVYAHFRQKRN